MSKPNTHNVHEPTHGIESFLLFQIYGVHESLCIPEAVVYADLQMWLRHVQNQMLLLFPIGADSVTILADGCLLAFLKALVDLGPRTMYTSLHETTNRFSGRTSAHASCPQLSIVVLRTTPFRMVCLRTGYYRLELQIQWMLILRLSTTNNS